MAPPVLQNTGRYKGRAPLTGPWAGGSTGGQGGGSLTGPREETSEFRLRQCEENDAVDAKYGFERVKGRTERTGWMINMHPAELVDEDSKRLVSAVDYYFVQQDGGRFKVSMPYKPYFYVLPRPGCMQEVAAYLTKRYGGYLASAEPVNKEDLDLPNHLVGLKQSYLKLSFMNVSDLMRVRKDVLPAVRKTKVREKCKTPYMEVMGNGSDDKQNVDQMDNMIDIREYDVPYHVRVSIDKGMFVGTWYTVKTHASATQPPVIMRCTDLIESPDCIVLAYDIETTKLPLKFPDPASDQVMMISYMIDGAGFLITNRDVVASDVEDFEYTPRPEFEGNFTIFNEPNEALLLQRFFDHVLDIRPHVMVTYNGDYFDWAFVEARAAVHGMDMGREVGFSRNKEGVYTCRPSIHMDCLCWVKRDSYLPVGSQNLKAVAKAKLRYDPVELDPEDMCRMAAEQPQVMASYSVSDAVATYYLYMKYIHPFIFALCTIIPMEPDEVLRKGSGTLCEALLMVEAFRAGVVFPNKTESIPNKMTSDGHVLEQETYVGGHVEALESGVFRSDIPCRFRLDPDMLATLYESAEATMLHAIREEEKLDPESVTNLDEVVADIRSKLSHLRDIPARLELPVIYHLDVGAMYPNIILTNRLQPAAVVNEADCAACDFNRPGATCQRRMAWTWRGDMAPASRSEFQRIQQQLEVERFPPAQPGGPHRAFHQLPKDEQVAYEKKRLNEYCRRAYKKVHVTRMEERMTTICQKENGFYIDTVRAFRDRRYEYKGLCKRAKREVSDAVAKGDALEIKSALNREVLYDSLQLAHKCILNSFYGYVMRKGARWHSMEMAGIVCYTGASIITSAREIVEKVGRPLELDTDGIWCVLPASFPENYVLRTTVPGKAKVTVSYPNAVLNAMVKDKYANPQYHELVDAATLTYEKRSENSIFFEVDGPYRAMVLPAAKEEGKKLKKRYAVFNMDGSLAELKGFEVKRRGELQLVKIFQSSVFDAFLRGDTLEECYSAVAKVADYWLDVLYSRGSGMPDSELFDLISENRSMSKKLSEYGAQKSTSISTAKRLSEFLGDQMVKDAGLSCRFIISRLPEGSPVTERAIPLAIFHAEPSVRNHYLRRWLKDSSMTEEQMGIRTVLDWNYYIERLGGTIQKIVTIPAALQGVANPVPRVAHPDWLHKRMLEKNDVLRQRRINDMFKPKPAPAVQDSEPMMDSEDLLPDSEDPAPARVRDIEDVPGAKRPLLSWGRAARGRKRKRVPSGSFPNADITRDWREVLGAPPRPPTSREEMLAWLKFHKLKWAWQRKQREAGRAANRGGSALATGSSSSNAVTAPQAPRRAAGPATLGGFLRRAQRTLLDTPWHLLQLTPTGKPGLFRLWALVGSDLHSIRLVVPRTFYVNQRHPKEAAEGAEEGKLWRKCIRSLPRSQPVYNLYEYVVPEDKFQENRNELLADLATPDIEGIYETQVPLDFRVLVKLGCLCQVDRQVAQMLGSRDIDTFELQHLQFKKLINCTYLAQGSIKNLYLFHSRSNHKVIFGLFNPVGKKGSIFVADTVRSDQMPNLNNMYNTERTARMANAKPGEGVPEANYAFETHLETDMQVVYRKLQRVLQDYKNEKKGPTYIAIESPLDSATLTSFMPGMAEFPLVSIHTAASSEANPLTFMDWQRRGSRSMIRSFLESDSRLELMREQCSYLHIPIGNLPRDVTLFGADLFYSRHLQASNFVLWCSPGERPDLGGKEADDSRLLTETEDVSGVAINSQGCYSGGICVDLEVDGLAVSALLQAPHVHDAEGTSSSVAFDTIPQASLEDMMVGGGLGLASYDEAALCSQALRVLRNMVNSWVRDVSFHRNVFADFQIIHMYRWLRSPSSLLYDPALRKTLHGLMKKYFAQLIAELKRLGSVVVYADFGKVILCTRKQRVEDALSYVEFVVSNVQNKELFHSLAISYQQCWEFLMWLDASNYGGVRGKVAGQDTEDSENPDDDSPEIEMCWNLNHYLPEAGNVQDNFSLVVAGYMSAVHRNQQEEMGLLTPGHTPIKPKFGGASQNEKVAPKTQTVAFSKDLVLGELAQKMFMMTQKIQKRLPGAIAPDGSHVFPQVPGMRRRLTNPALEFVKAVCKVLLLDETVEEEVLRLRRNLLRLLGVGEFGDEAEWKDPCLSFTLPEVICRSCSHCRDIDLCRDPCLAEEDGIPVWQCSACRTNYKTAEIEQLLMDVVHRKMMGCFLQDLQCMKCSQIKMDNMSIYCTCAGNYKTLVDSKEIIELLKTFRSVADHFKMPLLFDTTTWLLQQNAPDAHTSSK